MKCKSCKRVIEDNSIFCNWCGKRQIKEHDEITIPKPKKRKDHYSAQVMIHGERITVTGKTEAEYKRNANALKAGDETVSKAGTLKAIITDYINSNSDTLSPATIRGYDQILRNRFKDYINEPANKIDYQKLINDEAKRLAPKTVKNSWGLITVALSYADIKKPEVNLPAVPEAVTQFLDHKQVKIFLKAIEGDSAEVAALLALHSLRASEMYHLDVKDITKDGIIVRGATVRDKHNKWVDKETNKNQRSTRTIPVIIPRLLQILPESGRAVIAKQTTVREHIETACIKSRLPIVSLHDLRRTFACLAAYLKWQEETICAIGGWAPGSPIVHKIYIKVSNAAMAEDTKKMKNYYQTTTKQKRNA